MDEIFSDLGIHVGVEVDVLETVLRAKVEQSLPAVDLSSSEVRLPPMNAIPILSRKYLRMLGEELNHDIDESTADGSRTTEEILVEANMKRVILNAITKLGTTRNKDYWDNIAALSVDDLIDGTVISPAPISITGSSQRSTGGVRMTQGGEGGSRASDGSISLRSSQTKASLSKLSYSSSSRSQVTELSIAEGFEAMRSNKLLMAYHNGSSSNSRFRTSAAESLGLDNPMVQAPPAINEAILLIDEDELRTLNEEAKRESALLKNSAMQLNSERKVEFAASVTASSPLHNFSSANVGAHMQPNKSKSTFGSSSRSSASSGSSSSHHDYENSDNQIERLGPGVPCPMCGSLIDVPTEANVDVVMSVHIDRCSRRLNSTGDSRSNRVNRRRTNNDQISSDVEDTEGDLGDYAVGKRKRHSANEESLASSATNRSLSRRMTNDIDVNKPAVDEYDNQVEDDDDGGAGAGGKVAEVKLSLDDDWEEADYESRLAENGLISSSDENWTDTGFNTRCWSSTWTTLHDYQRDGCKWMYGLYQNGCGGILGDEMGLGKTAQLCAHFGSLADTLAHSSSIGSKALFLIVCPGTVLNHWLNEIHRWCPLIRAVILHAISKTGAIVNEKSDRFIELAIRRLLASESTHSLAVITTYEGVRKHKGALQYIEWTGVCLDEGQKIRNPNTDITAACKGLPSTHRMILSGTPIQNNLKELWSLFDFIYEGKLGCLSVFDATFAAPIRAGNYSSATRLQAETAMQTAAMLQNIVRPYLLRRRKNDLTSIAQLPNKTEQILFCKLSPWQREVYNTILASTEVRAVLERRVMAFRAINILRKLCNHPAMVFRTGRVMWDSEDVRRANKQKSKSKQKSSAGSLARQAKGGDDDPEGALDDELDQAEIEGISWSDSGKLLVLSKVLPLWFNEGHKVLLFTQTQTMLNLLEKMVKEFNYRYMRLDGMTPASKRHSIIETFNSDPSIFVMLLTTRTGGVGISLTSADRVVLVDPDWNPMVDIQARERAWRIGQKRDVIIYRLIMRGTIEEKIYQRQIFKVLLSNRILDNPKQKALFTKGDLRELFELSDEGDTSSRSNVDTDLPAGGEVIIDVRSKSLQMSSSASSSIRNPTRNVDSASSPALGTVFGGQIEEEEGEVVDTHKRVSDVDERTMLQRHALETETVDTVRIADSAALRDQEDSSTKAANSRDRRLLEALFTGEAITGIYDHNFLEPLHHNSLIRQQATQRVEEAVARMQPPPMQQRFGVRQSTVVNSLNVSTSSGAGAGMTGSSALLSAVRASQVSNLGGKSREQLFARLSRVFEQQGNRGLTAEFILSFFDDLTMDDGQLFKSVLRSIASLSNGVWRRT